MWDGASLFPHLVFYRPLTESWKLTIELSPAAFFPDPLLKPGSTSDLHFCPCVVSSWLDPGLSANGPLPEDAGSQALPVHAMRILGQGVQVIFLSP